LSELGEFTPSDKAGSKLFAMKRSAQQAPLEGEMLTDRTETRKKLLCAFRFARVGHATLAFACWLMAILSPIVQSGCSFDEHMLHIRRFRGLSW
jgi:hypothetical protein